MAIYTQTVGRGPDLVLVHGWGVHGGIWDTLLPALAQHYRVTCVDLPGHGYSRAVPMPSTLSAAALAVAEAVPAHATWIGWSLGGLIGLRAALDFPARLDALVLVSTTPRFVTASDWPHAMPPTQLQQFAVDLGRDHRQTLQRFLSLQVRGEAAARASLRQLRDAVFARGEPHPASLAAGLDILCRSDLRAELRRIRMPTLVLTGEYDRLTPPQAGRALAARIPDACCVQMPRTAHAPFLSRPADFHELLMTFLAGLPIPGRALVEPA